MRESRRIHLRSWVLVLVIALSALWGFGSGCGSDENEAEAPPDGSADDVAIVTPGPDSTIIGNDSGGTTDSGEGGVTTDGGNIGNNCLQPATLSLSPATKTQAVSPGGSFAQTYVVTATYVGAPTADVTAQSFLSISDPNIGSLAGATFTWGGVYGGTITVTAKHCGATATATLILPLSVGVGAADAGIDASGAATQFTNAPASQVGACAPTLVYPADGALLPPNTNVVQVHFTKGTPPNNLFEISFSNAVTDVRVYTACNGATAAQGMTLNGGCVFELDQAEWDYVAHTNRGADPVTVKVRGLGCDGGNVASSTSRQISFGQEDLAGTLYYWASMRIGGNTFTGGVFRYDFGVRGQTAEPVLTPAYNGNGLCIGCHDISRDGRKMIFDFDDNDADDEYTDVNTDIYDVACGATANNPTCKRFAKTATSLSKGRAFEPGYHTWNRSHGQFLLSDGAGKTGAGQPNFSFSDIKEDAGFAQPPFTPDAGTLPSATAIDGGTAKLRGTTPDWAPDDTSVVFSGAPNVEGFPPRPDGGAGNFQQGFWTTEKGGAPSDLFFGGASLYVSQWDFAANQLMFPPTKVLSSNGTTNYYYPSYSPDGSLIIYNFAADGPNFHNPKARVRVIAAGQATPTEADLAKLNDDTTVENGGAGFVTNSWARWAPFIQNYKGGKILWVTFSTTRNYGLQIENDAKDNCYPRESPQAAGNNVPSKYSARDFTDLAVNPACTRTQLWMAAVRLDGTAVAGGQDVSFVPFWLPFQDLTTNNHLGQWAQKSYTGLCTNAADAGGGTGPDGGGGCAPGMCCDNGGCIPCPNNVPPIVTCTADPNCAPGTCCTSGTCTPCSVDGGTVTPPGPQGCSTCLDCNGQACVSNQCGACTNSSQCCAPLECSNGKCVPPVIK